MPHGIEVTRDGAVVEVRLDRPKANAIDLAASRTLNDTFTAFRDDPELKGRHRHRYRRALFFRGLGS